MKPTVPKNESEQFRNGLRDRQKLSIIKIEKDHIYTQVNKFLLVIINNTFLTITGFRSVDNLVSGSIVWKTALKEILILRTLQQNEAFAGESIKK